MAEDLRDLRRRVAAVERVLGDGGERILGMIAEAVGAVLSEERGKVQRRFEEIESSRLRFMGIYEAGRWYGPGSLVVRNGGLWHCNSDTRDAPGASRAWQLAVKSGEASKGLPVA